MSNLYSEKCNRVFKIFEEISMVPRGSGYMTKISKYCIDFAERLGLKYVIDSAENIVIYKNASKGFEKSEPIILQGHLDMVWQKSADSKINFSTDPIDILRDGDFLKANGTTLGADNGIAVAMILAILENDCLIHPPIEAVFTTDEEIGMLGAAKLDMNLLSAKKMINIDSEEDDTITVSCAGGSDFTGLLPIKKIHKKGVCVEISINGLKGGHSGVEIANHRANANILLGRILNYLNNNVEFDIVSVNGGDKANAIPNRSVVNITTDDTDKLKSALMEYTDVLKKELACNEPDFNVDINILSEGEYLVLEDKDSLIFGLCLAPNGIIEMSAEIEGLPEISLNLGILETSEEDIKFQFALRSNKASTLKFLENRMLLFFNRLNASITVGGHYPPWEYKNDSALRPVYADIYEDICGEKPKVEAIHAGLECAVFSSAIKDIDCIAIGPNIFDAHTINERLSISSTEKIYNILLRVLEQLV